MKDRVIDWWRRRRWTKARYSRVVYFPRRSEVPDLPPRRTLAVVGSPNRPKWAVFACPCGHGHSIAVNLSSTRRPVWRLKVEEGGPSLYPSVDSLTDGRRCHFWLRDGYVYWAADDDVPSQETLPQIQLHLSERFEGAEGFVLPTTLQLFVVSKPLVP